MQAVGKTLWVEQESGINGVIAAAGSAPAYFFLFMQAIAEEAEAMGFSPNRHGCWCSRRRWAPPPWWSRTRLSPANLREQVTSKGTTAEAVKTFQEQG